MANQDQGEPVKVMIDGKEYRLCRTCDILYPEELALDAQKKAEKLAEEGEKHCAILAMLRACPLCAAREFCRMVSFGKTTCVID